MYRSTGENLSREFERRIPFYFSPNSQNFILQRVNILLAGIDVWRSDGADEHALL